jgi:hypothetical protein
MPPSSRRTRHNGRPWSVLRPGATPGDDGYAALLVIGTMSVLALLMPLMLGVAIRDLDDNKRHHNVDAAQDVARSGIQSVIAALSADPGFKTTPAVSVDPDVAQSGWSSVTEQYAWARAQLLARAATAGGTITGPTGSYAVLRPANQRVIYALGWPSGGTPGAQGKILVAEYTYPSAPPQSALLAGAEISLSGSFELKPSAGVPSADLHTNGSLTGTASSAEVVGKMTASGTASYSGATPGVTRRDIPTVDPRYFYAAYAVTYAANWYDLCQDGIAYQPNPSGVPCGPGKVPSSPQPANWTYNLYTRSWTEGDPGGPSGVYYVYGSTVTVGNASAVDQTIITEAAKVTGETLNLSCSKGTNANITVTKATVRAFIPGAVLVSGNSVDIGTQGSTYGGVVAAQESVSMSSSSSPGITGYVLAQNRCSSVVNEVNSFQGSSIRFDPTPGFLSPGPPLITVESELRQG